MTNAMETLFMSEETPSEDTSSAEKKEKKNPKKNWVVGENPNNWH